MSNAILLQARVQPDRHAKAQAAACALGISMAAYIDLLLDHEQLDEQDRPLWWTQTVPADQKELPPKTA